MGHWFVPRKIQPISPQINHVGIINYPNECFLNKKILFN